MNSAVVTRPALLERNHSGEPWVGFLDDHHLAGERFGRRDPHARIIAAHRDSRQWIRARDPEPAPRANVSTPHAVWDRPTISYNLVFLAQTEE